MHSFQWRDENDTSAQDPFTYGCSGPVPTLPSLLAQQKDHIDRLKRSAMFRKAQLQHGLPEH